MDIKYSTKITKLPPYLFAEIDRLKAEVRAKGKKILSLGIGDPDLPTPRIIVQSLKETVTHSEYHHYPSYEGRLDLRQQIAKWFKKRFKVSFDPDREILSLIGTKEGIGHFPFAFLEQNDLVLVPDPAYPVYRSGTIFAEGEPYYMPLLEENDFLPDLARIPHDIRNKAKIMFINYPNNPTSAMATEDFFKQAIDFSEKYNIILAHDAAYSELFFEKPPLSIFQIPGAKDIAIEFHSLSKTFNMTGWRIGFAVGQEKLIQGLAKIKNNLDSGIFEPIQLAAITALQNYDTICEENRNIYKRRRDEACRYLDELGWKYKKPSGTFYLWVNCLAGYSSKSMAQKLLEEEGIVVTPGVGFGPSGEGYIRMALTVDEQILEQVFHKIKKIKW